MGQFSWIYADTNEPMFDEVVEDSYFLIPYSFRYKYGKSIKETCYDGYGRMGGYDVYDLVAEFNKGMIPTILERYKNGKWHCSISDSQAEQMMKYYNDEPIDIELRIIGIIMACYDEDNFSLTYPIKITDDDGEYDDYPPSESDPNQGWRYY